MSAGEPSRGFSLDEEDRLPWLEPAGMVDEAAPVSPVRIVGLIAIGLLLLAVIIVGGYLLKNRDQTSQDGDAQLIAAQNENYKVAANASDAKSFDGEGDEAFEASEGREATGRIDASAVAEAPRMDLRPVAAPVEPAVRAATAKPTVSAPVRAVANGAAATAKPAEATEANLDGPRIQLGAFGSRALAADVWKKHSTRFDYLSPLKHSVETVETGGRTLFRLRAAVTSVAEANQICGRLRVAGENCMVVR